VRLRDLSAVMVTPVRSAPTSARGPVVTQMWTFDDASSVTAAWPEESVVAFLWLTRRVVAPATRVKAPGQEPQFSSEATLTFAPVRAEPSWLVTVTPRVTRGSRMSSGWPSTTWASSTEAVTVCPTGVAGDTESGVSAPTWSRTNWPLLSVTVWRSATDTVATATGAPAVVRTRPVSVTGLITRPAITTLR